MDKTLYYLTDWQKNNPSLADRYKINRETGLEALLANETIDTEFFIQLITIFSSESDLPVEHLKSFSLPVILDYLEKTHWFYINTKLLEIEQFILNIHRNTPENKQLPFLLAFFEWVRENLTYHIKMEEEQLFPYIKALYFHEPIKGTFSIQLFIDSHTDTIELQIGEIKRHIVKTLKSVTELFPYSVLLRQLDEFEKDLRIHARIEDEVLIPLAKKLEEEAVV